VKLAISVGRINQKRNPPFGIAELQNSEPSENKSAPVLSISVLREYVVVLLR
jgi:hypothetical protein